MTDPEFLFLFRLAFALGKSVEEVLKFPQWERRAWFDLFEIVGPLDWRRGDFLNARVNQFQAVGSHALKDFLLFPDPSTWEEVKEQTEDDVLKAFGYNPDERRGDDDNGGGATL